MNVPNRHTAIAAPHSPESLSMPPSEEAVPEILIVDDDGAVRAALNALVRSFGWKARVYASGRELLEDHTPGDPGCLVLDLHMPDMNGVEVQARLRGRGVDIPIVIITAFGDDPLIARARAAGVQAILTKPFRDDELLDTIARALGQPGP